MQGQNTAQLTSMGLNALIQGLVWLLGNRKTGMTGSQKFEHVVSQVLPQAAVEGAAIVAGNQTNPVTKASIETAVQTAHAALLAAGEIQDTAALEAQPGPIAPPPVIPPPAVPTSSPSPGA